MRNLRGIDQLRYWLPSVIQAYPYPAAAFSKWEYLEVTWEVLRESHLNEYAARGSLFVRLPIRQTAIAVEPLAWHQLLRPLGCRWHTGKIDAITWRTTSTSRAFLVDLSLEPFLITLVGIATKWLIDRLNGIDDTANWNGFWHSQVACAVERYTLTRLDRGNRARLSWALLRIHQGGVFVRIV